VQAIIQSWLDGQCRRTAGAATGVVLVVPKGGKELVAAAHWPSGNDVSSELEAAARSAYESQQAITQPRVNGAQRLVPLGPVVSCPILMKGRAIGAIAIGFGSELSALSQTTVETVTHGAESFEAYMRESRQSPHPANPNASALANGFAPSSLTLTQPGPILPMSVEDPTRTQPLVRSASAPIDPTRSSPGPIAIAPPPPAVPAGAIASPPVIPTLRNEVGVHTMELPTPNSQRILHLLATIEAHDRFREAATAFVTELATMFACDRVSIGFSGRRHVRVEALSHAAEFRSNQRLLRDIGAAMEEAIWQGATMVYPLPEGGQPRVDRAHADLAQRQGSAWIGTIPLVKSGKAFGAIVLERNGPQSLGRGDLAMCENIGALLGPLLEVKRALDKPWPFKIGVALREAAAPLFGPGHLAVKAVAATVLAVVAAASFVDGEYRVSSPAKIEGAVQRVMAAPMEGYVKKVHVRPGDRVKEGQLLAELADEDLRLEQRKAQGELAQLENSYGTALIKQDRAEVGIAFAKLDAARSQLELIQARLERTQIHAPFDGVVISGDLTQSLGAPVKKGETLMTLAPEHDFRVIVEVDERDIGDIRLGQPGYLALSALPIDTFPVHVLRITPVATAGQGRNYFEVEAQLKGEAKELRPGMLGVAKIESGARSLLWIWTHRVADWVRLTLWSWVG